MTLDVLFVYFDINCFTIKIFVDIIRFIIIGYDEFEGAF
jgi:hypothetical protein